MKRRKPALVCDLVIAVCLALGVATSSLAQGRGGPPGGGGMNGPGMGGPNFPNNGPPGGPPPQRGPGSEGPARVGLQLGPPGRWWDDKSMIKTLKLSPEQQTHMDAIFEQIRGVLLARFQNVQQAEAQMQELARSPSPDEGALFAQIDRVAQARAELDKTTTHFLLQLRKEMDAEQIKRLEKSSAR